MKMEMLYRLEIMRYRGIKLGTVFNALQNLMLNIIMLMIMDDADDHGDDIDDGNVMIERLTMDLDQWQH
jgi:hypothetical protein